MPDPSIKVFRIFFFVHDSKSPDSSRATPDKRNWRHHDVISHLPMNRIALKEIDKKTCNSRSVRLMRSSTMMGF